MIHPSFSNLITLYSNKMSIPPSFPSILDYFPPEIILNIVDQLSSTTIYEAMILKSILELCDWSFWRKTALIEFQTSPTYFDLAINRLDPSQPMSGAKRHLEISSKYYLNPDLISDEPSDLKLLPSVHLLIRSLEDNNVGLLENYLLLVIAVFSLPVRFSIALKNNFIDHELSWP